MNNSELNTNGTDYVSDAEFDALISELQIITEEARATDYHDTLRKAALFLNLLRAKVLRYANDIVRLDAACTEQHDAYVSACNRVDEINDLDFAKAQVRSSGYSLVSAEFIIKFAEFIQDWRKGDFDLPRLAAFDVEACFDAWQKEVNQNEVKPVLQALERVPMTEWQPIDTAPKDGRTLLLGYFNSHKKWRTMRGQWFSQDVINEEWEEPDMAGEGWYETCVENDDMPNCWWTAPTHWHPLPTPPESKG